MATLVALGRLPVRHSSVGRLGVNWRSLVPESVQSTGSSTYNAARRAADEARSGNASSAWQAAQDAVAAGRQAVGAGQQTVNTIIDAAQDLAAGRPPDFLPGAIQGWVNGHRPALHSFGVTAGNRAFDAAIAYSFGRAVTSSSAPSTPNPWMRDVVRPIADPVIDGFTSQVKQRARPYIRGALLIGAGALVGTFVLGRWSAR